MLPGTKKAKLLNSSVKRSRSAFKRACMLDRGEEQEDRHDARKMMTTEVKGKADADRLARVLVNRSAASVADTC
jgi:hypothetical protein